MDDTRYQFPSVTVSRKYDRTVNPELIARYEGEARKLLYELKNLMKFRNLGQLRMTRFFMDGTVITAWSIFGQDFIDIKPAFGILGVPLAAIQECTLTLLDLPDAIQPMRYPHEIGPDEVEGVDYIKTYYMSDISRCSQCRDIQINFLFTYDTPKEPRHYYNYIQQKPEPDNHCIWSWSPPCWGQVIGHGADEGGPYFIWKGFTETTEYVRNGLGVLLLNAQILDNAQQVICSFEHKIDVDCCRKDPSLRGVEIWWEDFGTCEPFMYYAGERICKMPLEVPLAQLIRYSASFNARPLYAIPDVLGSCLPMEWDTVGPITLINTSEPFKDITYFRINSDHCRDSVVITLSDRCGSSYSVIGTSCCQSADPLAIGYVTLVMSCNGQQTFEARNGCVPYSWSLSGGGTLVQFGYHNAFATYTAPSTNPNCSMNPTITLTDCCGNLAELKLAVNCYTSSIHALGYYEFTPCFGQNASCSCTGYISECDQCSIYAWKYVRTRWDCAGNIVHVCLNNPNCYWAGSPTGIPCKGPPGIVSCTTEFWARYYPPLNRCWLADCGYACPVIPSECDTLYDCRTQAQKDAGCCPINPLTGLPY